MRDTPGRGENEKREWESSTEKEDTKELDSCVVRKNRNGRALREHERKRERPSDINGRSGTHKARRKAWKKGNL